MPPSKNNMATNATEKPENEGGSGKTGKIEALLEAWNAKRNPFNRYINGVATAFQLSGLGLSNAALWLDASEAELWAVLRLALLGDDIDLLSSHAPPKTTWLVIAESNRDTIKKILKDLESRPRGKSAYEIACEAFRDVMGMPPIEKVASLPGRMIWHAAKKAKQYGAFSDKTRRALGDFAKRRDNGQTLTVKQAAFLYSLVSQLAEKGVIRRDTPDNDKEECATILDALGI
jgi:hypothetical protein